MKDRTHFVYEAYDSDGICLYVGCTGDPATRYRAHMAGGGDARGWFESFVTCWRVSGPYPKAVAFGMERSRIQEMQPIWNGHSILNQLGNRQLVNDYLRHHGYEFQINYNRMSRPDLVRVRRPGRRQADLRVVRSA